MITHIKFVSVPTRDQARAVRFWTEQVGLRILTDQPFNETQRWVELRVGNSDTRLVPFVFDENGPQPGMQFNATFACDDIDATYQELTSRGVEFTAPPTKQPWGSFAMFVDPDGNRFMLSTK